jgi:hypothetical protein
MTVHWLKSHKFLLCLHPLRSCTSGHTRSVVHTCRTAQVRTRQFSVRFKNVYWSPYTSQLSYSKKHTVRVREFVVKVTSLDEVIYYAVTQIAKNPRGYLTLATDQKCTLKYQTETDLIQTYKLGRTVLWFTHTCSCNWCHLYCAGRTVQKAERVWPPWDRTLFCWCYTSMAERCVPLRRPAFILWFVTNYERHCFSLHAFSVPRLAISHYTCNSHLVTKQSFVCKSNRSLKTPQTLLKLQLRSLQWELISSA